MTTVTKKKPRGKPWPKGVSGNPNGAPKRGGSWKEIIAEVGEMTPVEAAEFAGKIGVNLRKYGDRRTLKHLVVRRVYEAILFDPQPGLLNAFIERVDGKVKDEIEHSGSFTVNVTGSQWKPN